LVMVGARRSQDEDWDTREVSCAGGEAWRILHISDLHLARDANPNAFRRAVRERNPLLPQSHSFELLDGLLLAIKEIEQTGKIDLVVLTGDVSTDGTRRSLDLANGYLFESVVRSRRGRGPLHVDTLGLGLERDRVLLVPGNHDRYRWIPVQFRRA